MKPILRGEIYLAVLDDTIGSEQTGLRPVIILQNDLLNQHSPTTIVVPVTSILKHPYMKTHCVLPRENPLPEKFMALAEQIRTVDRRRLGAYIGRLRPMEIREIEQALRFALGLA